MTETKSCSTCKTEKPCAGFYRDRTKPDGLMSQCKECKKESDRRYRQRNPEKERERGRKWATANPERLRQNAKNRRAANPEMYRAHYRKWAAANPEKARRNSRTWRAANLARACETDRKYRAANLDKRHADYRKWASKNPEVRRAIEAARRARARNNTVSLTPADCAAVREVYADAALSTTFRLAAGLSAVHVDHREPIAKGGAHTAGNLQLLPSELNSAKGALTHAEALARLPDYTAWTDGSNTFEQVTWRTFRHIPTEKPICPS